jgi:predicted DNA-binding transcriptional regulator YafY
VFLERERGVTAVHLGVEEVVGLWVAAQLSLVGTTLPWNRVARSALNKVLLSLPRDRARTLRALVKRIVVGRVASPAVLMTLGHPPPELLTAFERAFRQHHCLAFDYVDRHGRATQRLVEPHGLLVEPPAWYLLTRDTQHGKPRMFRMDRVRRVRLSERRFEPDFDGLARDYQTQRVEERATGPRPS